MMNKFLARQVNNVHNYVTCIIQYVLKKGFQGPDLHYYIIPKSAALIQRIRICPEDPLNIKSLQILQAYDINFVHNVSRCMTA